MKKAYKWDEETITIVTCPYCHKTNEYVGEYYEKDCLKCKNPNCEKEFELGKQD